MRDALVAAARRGVDVRVIVDGFGAIAGQEFFAPLVEAGGKFCCFIAGLTRGYLIRNHQKLVVADSKVAMLGGFNVENAYFELPGEDGWSDLAFTVEGPVVERVEAWFDELEDWVAQPEGAVPRDSPQGARMGQRQRAGAAPDRRADRAALELGALRQRGPGRGRPARHGRWPISRRRRGCRSGSAASPARARRGCCCRRSPTTARRSRAARAYYSRLLRAGVRIWEFQPCRLHTKLIVLDDAVYLGSANFDARSLYINLEIVLYIEDAALARRLREYVEAPACRRPRRSRPRSTPAARPGGTACAGGSRCSSSWRSTTRSTGAST